MRYHQEVQQGFVQPIFQHQVSVYFLGGYFIDGYFSGVYQIGEV